jgi:hypothetical protein
MVIDGSMIPEDEAVAISEIRFYDKLVALQAPQPPSRALQGADRFNRHI